MYAGQSVLHNKIFATNTKHRPYSKHWPSPQELGSIFDEVAKDIPKKYRDSILMKGWREYGLGHELWSPTLCIQLSWWGTSSYITELEVQPLYRSKLNIWLWEVFSWVTFVWSNLWKHKSHIEPWIAIIINFSIGCIYSLARYKKSKPQSFVFS